MRFEREALHAVKARDARGFFEQTCQQSTASEADETESTNAHSKAPQQKRTSCIRALMKERRSVSEKTSLLGRWVSRGNSPLGLEYATRLPMSSKDDPPSRIGTQGWKQFLGEKRVMLAKFDTAKEQAKGHKVETYHGNVAESLFRDWLSGFLPKRYGVTAGYVISQGVRDDVKTPHFDVIIYDQLESPILWHEGYHYSRAVPAEFVRAIFEVKASLSSTTASAAMEHLLELEPILVNVDDNQESYKKYLPPDFFSAVVFFELRQQHEFSPAALDNLIPSRPLRGYHGGIILRGEGLPEDRAATIRPFIGTPPFESDVGKKKESLIVAGLALSNTRLMPDNQHFGMMLGWNEAQFANFAFDIVALLNGTYRPGYGSSFHARSWLNPDRKRGPSGPGKRFTD